MEMIRDRERWQIATILVLATLLRTYGLGLSEFHGDEVMIIGRSIALSKAPYAPLNLGIILAHIHPPVEIVLPIPFLLLLGVTEFTARLPFALAGIVSVYLIYRVSRRLFSREIGILSATLLCFCGFHLMFSRIVMATSIELTLVLLAVLSLIEAADHTCGAEGKRWVILGVSIGLCLLTQYHTLLLLPAVIYFLREKCDTEWWGEENVRIAILGMLVTIAPFYAVYFSAPIFFPQIGPTLGANYILQRGLGEVGFHAIYYLKNLINYCSVFYLSLVALGLLLSLKFLDDMRVRFCWIWLLSFFVPFLFFIRAPVVVYVMDGIPPTLILASIGLLRLRPGDSTLLKRRGWSRTMLPSLLCSVIFLSSFHVYNYTIRPEDEAHPIPFTLRIQGSHYRPYKSGWKAAGWFIRENTRGSDLYVSDGEGFVTRYYTNRRYLCEITHFFKYVNSSEWSNVRFIVLSSKSRNTLPTIWDYVERHYALAAIVRHRSSDSILIYGTEPTESPCEILLPENVDRLFDAKYGRNPETILSIYV